MRTVICRLAGHCLRRPSFNCHRFFGLGVFALWFQLGSLTAWAGDQLERIVKLNIAENTRLEDALIEWGEETGVTVMINTPTVERKRTHGVKGTIAARDALSALLRDSGLTYTEEGGRVLVVPITPFKRSAQRETGWETLKRNSNVATEDELSGDNPTPRASEQNFPGPSTAALRDDLNVVIVTAQKRDERLMDVPISMVAIGADELQKRNITTLDDLSLSVPGLAIQSSGSFQRRIEIRGISNTFGNSSLVGLYLDEADATVMAPSQLDLSAYDLDRVEVLRGPQGTLYGEGSAGGTVRLITKNPVLDRFTFDGDSEALFTQGGAPSQRINAALNVPLVDNQLGLRISGSFEHEGGWVDVPAAHLQNYNDQNLVDVRIKALWQPSPQFTLNAMEVIHRNNAPPNIGEDAAGNFTPVFNTALVPRAKDDYDLFNLTLTSDLSHVSVVNTTSYIYTKKVVDNLSNRFLLGPPGTPDSLFDDLISQAGSQKVLTDEFRLTSPSSGPWQWNIGAFYRHLDSPYYGLQYFDVSGAPLPLAGGQAAGRSITESSSVFGNASYTMMGRLTLGVGMRYFVDKEEAQDHIALTDQTGKFHSLDPRAYVLYKVADNFNIYSSAAKGFRTGGFNSANQPSFYPEDVWTYELGVKTSLVDGYLTADMAAFYSDYNNYQIVGNEPVAGNSEILAITSNAGTVTTKGIEWDVNWRPIDLWKVSVSGDYLIENRFTKINVTSATYNVGDSPDGVPRYTFTGTVEYDFRWEKRPGFARLDFNEQARESYRNRTFGDWYYSQSDVIHMLNFHAGLNWNDNLRLGLFAQNLLNDRGYTTPYSLEDNATRSRPRTYGIEFGVTFY
jgi:iron complex outermembrane recepter protein